jgi:hypothetical protein
MDPAEIGASLSVVREHLPLFVFLLLGLPVISILGIKCWIASGSSKTQRTTDWFVPDYLDSESARLHYSMQHNSVAFAHRVGRDSRGRVALRKSGLRRSA